MLNPSLLPHEPILATRSMIQFWSMSIWCTMYLTAYSIASSNSMSCDMNVRLWLRAHHPMVVTNTWPLSSFMCIYLTMYYSNAGPVHPLPMSMTSPPCNHPVWEQRTQLTLDHYRHYYKPQTNNINHSNNLPLPFQHGQDGNAYIAKCKHRHKNSPLY